MRERCNSQFTVYGHKCERVYGHDGQCAVRGENGKDGFIGSSSILLTPSMAAMITWFDDGWSFARTVPPVAAATPQPAPTPRTDQPAVTDLVLLDFQARDAFGQRKYGTRLQPHNGRDALIDAYQELLDACCYVRQLIFERDGK